MEPKPTVVPIAQAGMRRDFNPDSNNPKLTIGNTLRRPPIRPANRITHEARLPSILGRFEYVTVSALADELRCSRSWAYTLMLRANATYEDWTLSRACDEGLANVNDLVLVRTSDDHINPNQMDLFND